MSSDVPLGTVKPQQATNTPVVGDATLVDDTTALVDSTTALVGGQATIVPLVAAQVRTTVPRPILRING